MRLCVFLIFAGILDAVLTYLGVTSGFIEEANPLMRHIIEKGWLYFYLIKVFMPIVLISLFYLRPLKGWPKTLLVSTCVLYLSVLMYHIVWIVLYFTAST